MNMTTDNIKKIVTDEEVERLTTAFCHHWTTVTERLSTLAEEAERGDSVCLEAEMYAALARMQQAATMLTRLNQMPDAFLYSCYTERLVEAVSDKHLGKANAKLFHYNPR